jgi:hypothetical protein
VCAPSVLASQRPCNIRMRLPTRVVSAITSKGLLIKHSTECGICYEEYASNGEAPFRLAKCGHLFGNKCIGRWFEEERKKTCPMCRCIAVSDRELYKY